MSTPFRAAVDGQVTSIPEVPTFDEIGIKNFKTAANISIVGPAGLPEALVSKLNKAFADASAAPEVVATYESQGLLKMLSTPEELGEIVRNEQQTWGPLMKSLKLTDE